MACKTSVKQSLRVYSQAAELFWVTDLNRIDWLNESITIVNGSLATCFSFVGTNTSTNHQVECAHNTRHADELLSATRPLVWFTNLSKDPKS